MNNIIQKLNPIINDFINDKFNSNFLNTHIKKIYIINLLSNKSQEIYVKLLMEKLQINYTLIQLQITPNLYYNILNLLNISSEKLSKEEATIYLSHLWCLFQIIKNNLENAVILNDNVIIHKELKNLFKNILGTNTKIKYDFLILGYDQYNNNLEKNSIYISNEYIKPSSIFYSNNGAKTIYNYFVDKQKTFLDNLILFTLFDKEKAGFYNPALFINEKNILKNNDNNLNLVDLSNYNLIVFDLINKACIMDTKYYKNHEVNNIIRLLLNNYFNNNKKNVDMYFDIFKTNFFNTYEYLYLIDSYSNIFDRFFYRYYYNHCKQLNITPGTILLDNIEYKKYKNKFWKNYFSITFNNKYNKFPYLFHKQLLQLREPLEITYNIIIKTNINKNLISHLHCYNIDKFAEFYENYYKRILERMDIVITYCTGTNIPKIDATILKINNFGYDVGAKFSFMKYLNDNNIDYKYILFLQSKSCPIKRALLFDSLVDNLDNLFEKIKKNNGDMREIGGFVPPFIISGNLDNIIKDDKCIPERLLSKYLYQSYTTNICYTDEIENYFNISESKKNITIFPYGNIYMLHKNIANILYRDREIYNCLNDVDSFDYNWVKQYYNIKHDNINFVYQCYKKYNLCGNNLKLREQKKIYVASDFMVEHLIERILFKLIKSNNMDLEIIPNKENREKLQHLSKIINNSY